MANVGMPPWSQGRVYLLVAFCLVVLFFVDKFQHEIHVEGASAFSTKQFRSSKALSTTIANDTLGFEKIMVINAPWRSDRKDSISLAASYTGISLDWIDGISADDMQDKAYPPGNHKKLPPGNLGSWRAHMNALREIVEKNLTTAMILEDDADWDFRIRSQLTDVAHGAQEIPDLVAQSELRLKESSMPSHDQLSPVELAGRSSLPISLASRQKIAKLEPYGRNWDVLWLGHCGATLSPPSPNRPDRIFIPNDLTIPSPKHLRPTSHSPLDAISTLYPPHTRIIHRANTTLCTIAYAVTQSGARKLLYEFGVREFDRGYDFALSDYCNGLTRGATRERLPMCVAVSPPVFSHHFAEKATSDIVGVGPGGRTSEGTRYVTWSVRMNLERLVRGQEEMVQQWGDGPE
ncbi:glycosyltransferase family 25 protein [Pleomassaria siparia CBS 279.74]|uniref:Glycosyltransferase family 25 protein n=1 Tax=Pleomassaria siparia CBS 279.74 TaxID=1314801 RepID=A0A6G1K3B6_9PLEO|nr:glycosyltransferase family 25 protein [Pleomassaria siparia CBS 279.74]